MNNALPVTAYIGEANAPNSSSDIGARACFVTRVQIERPSLTAILAKVNASDIPRAISSGSPTNLRCQKE
jgi:hypothetical protein